MIEFNNVGMREFSQNAALVVNTRVDKAVYNSELSFLNLESKILLIVYKFYTVDLSKSAFSYGLS